MTVLNAVKMLHVASILFWIGTLFVLQVLMHRQYAWAKQSLLPLLKNLYFKIDLPVMFIAIATGGVLLYYNEIDFKAPWFHAKMTGILCLVITDIWLGRRIVKGKKFYLPTFVLYVVSLTLVLGAIYMIRDKKEEWFKKYIIGGCEALIPMVLP